MNKNLSKTFLILLQLTLCSTLLFFTAKPAIAQPPPLWWDKEWLSATPVNLTETLGKNLTSELVDVHITFEPGTCREPNKEIRVVHFDGVSSTEVTSQVYNVTTEADYAKSCNVVFLADCPAYSTATYYIYYNPSIPTEIPEYDGLRLDVEAAGDTYNIPVLVDGVEKNYSRLFYKHLMDLYSDDTLVCWPGGQAGWEFSQIVLASLWADGAGNPWFSVGDILTVANSGPLFVEFNITQPVASDLWGTIFNNNVSTTYMVKVYYQPDLNPLVSYHMSITFREPDIVKNPYVVDFKLANSTSYEIYQDFTWKNVDEAVTTVSAKDDMPQNESIWSAAKPYGWFSYTGGIPGMPDQPAANIGLIPTYAGGTSQSANYAVNFIAEYTTQPPPDPYFDHHCSTQLFGVTTGIQGDVIESKGFIKVYPLTENAEPTMSEIAAKLRDPESLQTTVGEPYTIGFVDRKSPTVTGIVPAMDGQEIVEGKEVNLKVTVTDNPAILLGLIIQESGVDQVSLHYSTDDGKTWEIIDMTKVGETDVYNSTIPGFRSGTKVRYMISATDENGNEETSPTYWYKVRIPSQTGMWLIIGIAIGFTIAIMIAGAAFYIRKKP